MPTPNPTTVFPLPHYDRLCFLKNIINNPNILVGDFTYYDDFEDVRNFEKNVKYHFPFIGDKLIIGKFCAIASGAEFIMNGGNHLIDAVSTFPFEIFGGDWSDAMQNKSYPYKGNIEIENDVWIGYKSVITAGVKIGNGAIIASYSVVSKDIEPYTIVGGNPAKVIKKRFSDEQIAALLKIKWWDWELSKITENLSLLTDSNINNFIDKNI